MSGSLADENPVVVIQAARKVLLGGVWKSVYDQTSYVSAIHGLSPRITLVWIDARKILHRPCE